MSDAPARSGAGQWGGLLSPLAVVLSLQTVAVLEVLHVPRELWFEDAGLLVAYGHVLRASVEYLWMPLACVGALALLLTPRVTERVQSRLHLGLVAGVAGLASMHAWWQLARYDGFREAPVLVAPFVLLTAGLVVLARWPRFLAPLAVLAGIGVQLSDYIVEPHLYPTLHYSGLLVATILIGAGVAHARWPAPRTARRRAVVVIGLAAPLLLGLFSFRGERAERVGRYVNARTMLGQARLVLDLPARAGTSERAPLLDPDARDRFVRHAGLPPLPEEFSLADHNVLLITIETLRYDATSFGDPERGLTPNMAKFAHDGAAVFHRAYAPSSGTLQSMASILSMHYPSGALLELEKSWKGTLSEDETTVAELLRDAGFGTWVVSHSHKHVFTQRILGLQQGFSDVELVLETPKRESALVSDAEIVDEANHRLERFGRSGERFFGWVFLVSPHVPYVTRDDQQPHRRPHDRYRQEVEHVDAQLGRLLEQVRSRGLLENTVVIVAGDHGEEFGEHGGKKHASTVYEESVRVPLLVWIPGVSGKAHTEPTSLVYLFPWLLSSAAEGSPLQTAARTVLETEIGPVLHAAQGGVIVESIGHKRHQTALVRSRLKLVYDHLSDVYEAYDLAVDAMEADDLALAGDARVDRLTERFEAYMDARESFRRFTLSPPQ